jgi:hypothetical protein
MEYAAFLFGWVMACIGCFAIHPGLGVAFIGISICALFYK